MKLDSITKLLLTSITLLLTILVFRPVVNPAPVHAQPQGVHPFYIEPGYTMLRKPDGSGQIYGKMVVDMSTGEIWGFPTGDQVPYPIDPTKSVPPKSHPFFLGQFDFSQAKR